MTSYDYQKILFTLGYTTSGAPKNIGIKEFPIDFQIRMPKVSNINLYAYDYNSS